MICEMCGSEVPNLKSVRIEGTALKVCPNCSKFGQETTRVDAEVYESPKKTVVSEGLERREKRMRPKDVFLQAETELVADYPERIREARAQLGLSQEDLGKRINEKRSVIAKLETADMRPDDKLIKKLEKALEISLMEEVKTGAIQKRQDKSKGLTLGDLIKIEEK